MIKVKPSVRAAAAKGVRPTARKKAAAAKTPAVAKVVAVNPVVVTKPTKPNATIETVDTKVVRDGFTMPKGDYDLLKSLKAQCLASGVDVKKSELLRAGVQALATLPAAELLKRMRALPAVKAGSKKQ